MTDQPITKAQLDALEKVADRVFDKLGIDIEFTHHFLDRVNDERNQKQITIRELGQLFAKEYQRWGRTISQMPIDAQAVMKDLSSAINIPFVLNKDGNGKDLVAKTVMRKKNFSTPDKTLPVESVNQLGVNEAKPPRKGTVAYNNMMRNKKLDRDPERVRDIEKTGNKNHQVGNAKVIHKEELSKLPRKGTQVKGSDATPSKRRPTTGGSSPHPMRGKLVGEEAVNEVSGGTVIGKKNGYPVHDMGENYPWPEKRFLIRNPNLDVWQSSHSSRRAAALAAASYEPAIKRAQPTPAEIEHDNWRDEQKNKIATGQVRKAVLSRRGLGEMDQPPFTIKTLKPSHVADKHGVDIELIKHQLRIGIKIEMEHTTDRAIAMEIALDHLSEMPDYYTNLADMESNANETFIQGAWETEQIRERMTDPREAILRKALQYLDAMVKSKGTQQDVPGYAFDIVRSFNLKDILNARELANLYREWKAA
jgi:hypothetical protein